MHGLVTALNLPDLWQQEATRILASGSDVIVNAPTGAGKTRVFELLIESTQAARHGQAVFTVPTRALANDKWREWQARGWNVGLATGDRADNVHAPVLVATLETQRERILSGRAPEVLVIDEYQMVSDVKRGLNYELVLALLPVTSRILLLSGSVRNPGDIADWLRRLGRHVEVVEVKDRPVPLDDFPVEQLPRVPDAIQGFWPRLVSAARTAGLTPLLVFAPRRADAEKIAKKVAEGLPMSPPLNLPESVDQSVGRDLAKLLRRRVAFHHSGLSYEARAGWIEPLAKNGHLDVIVATTGLAAGINFSVRSVFVAETKYFDGPYQRELRPDELLQMFGRAGRRGIDTRGTVLAAPESPRLLDAAPRQLRRVNQIDWPTLLRVMEEAANSGEPPLDAAADICSRLFSKQSIHLGVEERPESDVVDSTETPGRFEPTREEIFGSDNVWRARGEMRSSEAPLAAAYLYHKDRWQRALRVAAVVEPLGPGRLCKLLQPDGTFDYGKDVGMARLLPSGMLAPHPWLRKKLHLDAKEAFSPQDFSSIITPLLAEYFRPGKPEPLVIRDKEVSVRLTFHDHRVPAWIDPTGKALLDPPKRRATILRETGYRGAGDYSIQPRAGSASHAWRKLGLVDEHGVPTARGRISSRFQGGEGLVISAALEDSGYEIADLVLHLANIRGGHRFEEFAGGASDRLAFASRSALGHVDHEGYLVAGLCPGYGEGTSEAIERFRSQGMTGVRNVTREIRNGDVERAILEWLSLLRHVVHAPDPKAPRWAEFQSAARSALDSQPNRTSDFQPALPARLMQRAEPRVPTRNRF